MNTVVVNAKLNLNCWYVAEIQSPVLNVVVCYWKNYFQHRIFPPAGRPALSGGPTLSGEHVAAGMNDVRRRPVPAVVVAGEIDSMTQGGE
jgi:hypothetical protein